MLCIGGEGGVKKTQGYNHIIYIFYPNNYFSLNIYTTWPYMGWGPNISTITINQGM